MSPEQARGLKIDHRSDIFSFGIVLHEILTGERPSKESTAADTVSAILNRPAPRLAGRVGGRDHKELQEILNRSLAKDPDERYQSMRDVAAALTHSRRSLASDSTAFWRRPLVGIGGVALLVTVGGAAIWSMYRSGQERWAREEAIPQIVSFVEADDYVGAYESRVRQRYGQRERASRYDLFQFRGRVRQSGPPRICGGEP